MIKSVSVVLLTFEYRKETVEISSLKLNEPELFVVSRSEAFKQRVFGQKKKREERFITVFYTIVNSEVEPYFAVG